jgi:hypothetical protein
MIGAMSVVHVTCVSRGCDVSAEADKPITNTVSDPTIGQTIEEKIFWRMRSP